MLLALQLPPTAASAPAYKHHRVPPVGLFIHTLHHTMHYTWGCQYHYYVLTLATEQKPLTARRPTMGLVVVAWMTSMKGSTD